MSDEATYDFNQISDAVQRFNMYKIDVTVFLERWNKALMESVKALQGFLDMASAIQCEEDGMLMQWETDGGSVSA